MHPMAEASALKTWARDEERGHRSLVEVTPFIFSLSHYLSFLYGPLTAVSQARLTLPLANLKAYRNREERKPVLIR